MQLALILGCGIGGGLVVAFGPVRSLAWLFNVHRPNATWGDFVRRVALFAVLTGIGISVIAAERREVARPEFLLVTWMLFLLYLMGIGPKWLDTARRRWTLACGTALAAVYGPFVLVMLNTWLVDGTNTWLQAELWKYLPVIPGGAILEMVSAAIWHRRIGETVAVYALASLLSAVLWTLSAWSMGRVCASGGSSCR